jgi:hypothetical protein
MPGERPREIFLALLGRPEAAGAGAVIPLPGATLPDVWEAFRQFIARPLEHRTVYFELEICYSDERQIWRVSFRRHFFDPGLPTPDPGAPRFLEARLLYRLPSQGGPGERRCSIWVDSDPLRAAQAFVREVEDDAQLWSSPLAEASPHEVFVF